MLKAVLCGFSGVILNDQAVHQQLVESLLLDQNLRPDADEYVQRCWGRSDQACLSDLLTRRGRLVTDRDMQALVAKKTQAYADWLATQVKLPFYPGLEDLIFRIQAASYAIAIVTGRPRTLVTSVLQKATLLDIFPIIVSAEQLPSAASKPAPDTYLMAIQQLNQQHPTWQLQPQSCVAIESTFAGIEAAKSAGIPVIGVAHTYPYHMIQRCATWAVDYLSEIDFDWICQRYAAEKVLLKD